MKLSSPFVLGHAPSKGRAVPQIYCTIESRNPDGSVEFHVVNGAWNGRLHLGMMTVYGPRGNDGPHPVQILAQGAMLNGMSVDEAFDLIARRQATPAMFRIPVYVYPLLSGLTRLPGALPASCRAFTTVFKSVMRHPNQKAVVIHLSKPDPKEKSSWVCGNTMDDDIPF